MNEAAGIVHAVVVKVSRLTVIDRMQVDGAETEPYLSGIVAEPDSAGVVAGVRSTVAAEPYLSVAAAEPDSAGLLRASVQRLLRSHTCQWLLRAGFSGGCCGRPFTVAAEPYLSVAVGAIFVRDCWADSAGCCRASAQRCCGATFVGSCCWSPYKDGPDNSPVL